MIEFVIRFDPQTGQFQMTPPGNFVIALGMLESAKEFVLATQLRPAVAPKVVGAVAMPTLAGKGN